MISHAAEICKKYKMPFIIFPTIEKKSIEEWVNIGANMLCLAQDSTNSKTTLNYKSNFILKETNILSISIKDIFLCIIILVSLIIIYCYHH